MNTEPLVRYLDLEQSTAALRQMGSQLGVTEFAGVRNLGYAYAPFEVHPLAPRITPPLERVAAFAIDMDGTSTTTEPLALHALEYMVRRFTGRLDTNAWSGLDPRLDHPYVIGNSNYRHTEFVVERYRDHLDEQALCQAFIAVVCWTLTNMADTPRSREVERNAQHCGLAALLADAEFQELIRSKATDADNVARLVTPFVKKHSPAFHCEHTGTLVSAALDVYYMRYHSILQRISQGAGAELSRELLGAPGKHLIEPMPGYDVFVPVIKGWLGPEADALYDPLHAELETSATTPYDADALATARGRLVRTAEYFERQPAKLALVTASIRFEAETVTQEVLRRMANRVEGWPISAERKQHILGQLGDYCSVFDAFINASDACEHRLKPHPDLYSLALQQLSIPPGEYRYVIGLEDTEPGIVSLRSAGIGCAVALPNRDTSGQQYAPAAQVLTGGLPELLLLHDLIR